MYFVRTLYLQYQTYPVRTATVSYTHLTLPTT